MVDYEALGLMIISVISAMGIKEALLRYVSPRDVCGGKDCINYHNNHVNSEAESELTK